MKHHKWNENEINELIYYYTNEGLSVKNTAIKINKTERSTRAKIKRLKLTNNYHRPWTDVELVKLIKDNNTGMSVTELAKKLNRNRNSLANKMRELNIPFNRVVDKPHEWTEQEINKLKKLVSEGYVVSSIANQLKISKYAIIYYCEKENLPLKRAKRKAKWTAEEEYILRECLENKIILKSITNKLNRTKFAIIEKMQELGLKATSHLNEEWHKKGNSTGYGEISGSMFSSMRTGAKSRNLDFNISIQQFWELFLKQGRRCAFTGIELLFSKKYASPETTASSDRIDSSKGYIEGNTQWIHKELNVMKMDMPEDRFFYWINLIYNYRVRQINEQKEQETIEYFI